LINGTTLLPVEFISIMDSDNTVPSQARGTTGFALSPHGFRIIRFSNEHWTFGPHVTSSTQIVISSCRPALLDTLDTRAAKNLFVTPDTDFG